MFRIPETVSVISFNSGPKQSGWFGREGFAMTGIFEFNPGQLAEFTRDILLPDNWKPVRDPGLAPEIDAEYTTQALRWLPLPLPKFIKEARRLKYVGVGTDRYLDFDSLKERYDSFMSYLNV